MFFESEIKAWVFLLRSCPSLIGYTPLYNSACGPLADFAMVAMALIMNWTQKIKKSYTVCYNRIPKINDFGFTKAFIAFTVYDYGTVHVYECALLSKIYNGVITKSFVKEIFSELFCPNSKFFLKFLWGVKH